MNVIVCEKISPPKGEVPESATAREKRRNSRQAAYRLDLPECAGAPEERPGCSRTYAGRFTLSEGEKDEGHIERLASFLSSAANGDVLGVIVHENRLIPNKVGMFDKSMVSSLIRIFVRDFFSSEKNTSICSSFDGVSKMMHIDVNSRVPFSETL
ncbi:MAG: hypothetical protein LBI17_03975, partial [Rickettsiales bacterium]|nr:hypothetical protein [Rickettsiales bacterium]